MSAIHHALPNPSSCVGSDATAIRVAVLDDHPAMRAGVEAMLAPAPDVRFVGAAAAEKDLWTLLARTQPTVLVLDLHHPGRDGLALCAEVKRRHTPPAVVLYTAAAHPDVTIAAVIAGADAILHKTAPPAALLHTIRASAVPASAPPPAVSSRHTARAAARLEPSEHAIFAMRLAGNSPQEIADTLSLPVTAIHRRIVQIADQLAATGQPARAAGDHGRTGLRARPSAFAYPAHRRWT